jgi:hypothetical protein
VVDAMVHDRDRSSRRDERAETVGREGADAHEGRRAAGSGADHAAEEHDLGAFVPFGMIEEREAGGGATVVLVPDNSRRFTQSYYKVVVARSNGAFSFKGVPPGVYQLFAWESIPETAWLNPDFMSRWEGRGQVVSMEAGGRVTVQIRLFSKDD